MRIFKRDRLMAIAIATVMAGAVATGTSIPATAQSPGKTMTTASGLQIADTKAGTGATPTHRPDLRHALHGLALSERRQGREVRQLGRPRPAVRVPHRRRAR